MIFEVLALVSVLATIIGVARSPVVRHNTVRILYDAGTIAGRLNATMQLVVIAWLITTAVTIWSLLLAAGGLNAKVVWFLPFIPLVLIIVVTFWVRILLVTAAIGMWIATAAMTGAESDFSLLKEVALTLSALIFIAVLAFRSLLGEFKDLAASLESGIAQLAERINLETSVRSALGRVFAPDTIDEIIALPPRAIAGILRSVLNTLGKLFKMMSSLSIILLVTSYVIMKLDPSDYLVGILVGLIIIAFTNLHTGKDIAGLYKYTNRLVGAIVIAALLAWTVDSYPAMSVGIGEYKDERLAYKLRSLKTGFVVYPDDDGRPDFDRRLVLSRWLEVYRDKDKTFKSGNQKYYRCLVPNNIELELRKPLVVWSAMMPLDVLDTDAVEWVKDWKELAKLNSRETEELPHARQHMKMEDDDGSDRLGSSRGFRLLPPRTDEAVADTSLVFISTDTDVYLEPDGERLRLNEGTWCRPTMRKNGWLKLAGVTYEDDSPIPDGNYVWVKE